MRGRQRPELGLRARVTLAFACGALVLSVALSGVSYGLVRNYLVEQTGRRPPGGVGERRLARDGLRTTTGNLPRILATLQDPDTSPSLVFYDDNWFSSKPLEHRPGEPPVRLRQAVNSGRPPARPTAWPAAPRLAVGLPIPAVEARYFEVFSLEELDRTLASSVSPSSAPAWPPPWPGRRSAAGPAPACCARWPRWPRPRRPSPAGRSRPASGADDADLAMLVSSFNSMVDALQDRIERDARFASDVSHELRSPLTTLATTVGVLASRREEMPGAGPGRPRPAHADVERFQRLVEDLLEISRFDAGVAELHLEEVSLAELVRRAVASVGGPPVELGPGAVADGLAIQVDKRRMERVIANLVENAAHYGGGATRVIVDAGHNVARVAVEDEGPGVAPEEREAIFERFFRGSAAGQRRGGGQGSGLGLALVAEHVRLHGGRVWVEDNPVGTGARFVVEIPLGRTA